MSSERTCIVIGASGGMGQALCRILAQHGWRLVLAGRDADKLQSTATELQGSTAATQALDASDFDAVTRLFEQHANAIAAVNFAGSILLKPAHATTRADFDTTISQNIATAFAVVRAAASTMRAAGGSVVLMSSCAAQIGLVNHEAISAAKAAVEGLTRAAAATYATHAIRFNAVAPGLTDTPMAAKLTANDASRKASEAMHPLGRIGNPDEIARCIAFLLDPDNSWITGQTIGVDGGLARAKGR